MKGKRTEHCSCGRVISGNKTLCMACVFVVVNEVSRVIAEYHNRVDELGHHQMTDDGGPAQ